MFKRFVAPLMVHFLVLTTSTTVFATVSETPEGEAQQAVLSEAQQYQQQALALWQSLNRQNGKITLASGAAEIDVPESFFFLNGADAEKVLVEAWGNPPGQQVLGMLMPSKYTPFDPESWAVTISYEQDGYVSDDDANEIDYDDLLSQMQKDTQESSKARVQQGYEPIALVGWAAKPYYDAQSHKLHWAKEIKFGDQQVNTLNYNIRVLGRKGVLVLNFIAGMEQLPEIEQQLPQVLAMTNFSQGSRYSDFNPDIDQVAAYGIGALVAGKVLAKTGFLALALVFLKKFGVFILVALGGLLTKAFGRKKRQQA